MFRENRIIYDMGALKKVTTALDITKPKADTYKESLHDNNTSGAWNSEKIETAQKVSVKVKDIADDIRSKLKNVFWEMPKDASKKLTSMLSKATLTFPAWLWTKTTQLPANLSKLVTSGVLVINAEIWEALDAPARLMVRMNNRVQSIIGGNGGHAAPAH